MTLREQAEKACKKAKVAPWNWQLDLLVAFAEAAEQRALREAAEATWQPVETAPKDRTIIGALIRDGRIWRVHEMKHNGLAFYTRAGGSLPQMTHWMPLPDPPRADNLSSPVRDGETKQP